MAKSLLATYNLMAIKWGNSMKKNYSMTAIRPIVALLLFWLLAGIAFRGQAQAPTISYITPQTYYAETAIAALSPTSSGVAAPGYSNSLVDVGAGLSSPRGIAIDAAGNIYVANSNNNLVEEIPAGGGATIDIGSGFSRPSGVAVDAAGNVYVADGNNNVIKKISISGGATVTIASGFNSPLGVAVDVAGNVYVADQGNNAVKKIPVGGGPTVSIGSGFSSPWDVAVDAAGNVYVADALNHEVKKILPGNNTPVVIGSGFIQPFGVAVDASGNVYVADNGNIDVKEIPVGGGAPVAMGSGFTDPWGIAVDGSGNVYVSQQSNTVLKEIKPVGGYYISALPSGLSFDAATGTISGTPAAGSLPANYTVTAYNSSGGSIATVNIKVIAILNLLLSKGTLTPAFTVGTGSYTASVGSATTSVTVTPIVTDPTASVAIALNGGAATAVASGTTSGSLPLNVGANTITAKVIAPGGITTKSYTITIGRGSNDAWLSHIILSSGTLTASGATGFNATVSGATTAVTVTPTTTDPNATVTVALNGGTATAVASGTPSPSLPLTPGGNTIVGKVTAQDGVTTQIYTITIGRGSNDAFLSHLTMTGGMLTAAGATSFTASVSNATASVTVTPTTTDPNATVTVALNGGTAVTVTSGTASTSLPLNIGANTITTKVTAQDRVTTKTYIITVARPPSSDAFLSHIVISGGSLTATGPTSFTESVSNTTTSFTVIPTSTDPGATLTIAFNGGAATPITSGSLSAKFFLNVGANTITILVTAPDGITTKTYVITVTRAPSSDAYLSAVWMNIGFNDQLAASGPNSYTAPDLANQTTSVTVTPTADNPASTMTIAVNGGATTPVTSGMASANLFLNVDENIITIVVTAQDGITKQTFTIPVYREPSSNDSLSNMAISSGTLSPFFVSATSGYTASVSNATTGITVTPTTADPDATVTVAVNGGTATAVTSGTASGNLFLNVGANTITTVVTASDEVTTQTYTITVTRVSNNAFLSHISMSGGTLTAAGSTSFTASVGNATTSVTVTPTTLDPNATVTVAVNGGTATAVTSGMASGNLALNVGSNTISTKVTAQDSITTQTYTITVTRATGPLMSLYLPVQPLSVTKQTDSLTIENDGIMVHQGVSPNGDGVNDYLLIDGLVMYPNNELTIINRSGAIIFEAKGYDNITNVFDGHSSINGRMQQPGTYFYALDYSVNGVIKRKTGYIILKY